MNYSGTIHSAATLGFLNRVKCWTPSGIDTATETLCGALIKVHYQIQPKIPLRFAGYYKQAVITRTAKIFGWTNFEHTFTLLMMA